MSRIVALRFASKSVFFYMLALAYFVAVLPWLAMPPPASATTYYVDSTLGKDSNDGTTPIRAWQTLNRVNAFEVAPGDRVLFRRGQLWRGTLTISFSGIDGAPITYGAYGSGDDPIISGADLIEVWRPQQFTLFAAYSCTLPFKPFTVFENGKRLGQAQTVSDLSPGTWCWDDFGSTLFLRTTGDDFPSNYTIEAGQRGSNISIFSKQHIIIESLTCMKAQCRQKGAIDIVNSDFITLRTSKVLDALEKSVWFRGSNFGRVANCTITSQRTPTGYKSVGIEFGEYGDRSAGCKDSAVCNSSLSGLSRGIVFRNQQTATVHQNSIYNMSGYGIWVTFSSHVVLENNTIHDTCRDELSNAVGIGGSRDDDTHHCIVRFNDISNTLYRVTDGCGIFVDIGTHECLIYGNMICGTTGSGIRFFYAHDNEVFCNVLVDTGKSSDDDQKSGICVNRSFKNSIHRNILWKPNKYGLILMGSRSSPTHSIVFKNNIVVGSTAQALRISDEFSTDKHDFDYNEWGLNSGIMSFWNGTIYSDLTAYKFGTGQDRHSIVCEPRLGDKFRLLDDSPCLRSDIRAKLWIVSGECLDLGRGTGIGACESDKWDYP